MAVISNMAILRPVFDFLRSKALALGLMIVILAAIFVGTVFLPEPVGRRMVFRAFWFNALLVLLVLNTAFCFFSRIKRRAWDLAYAGTVIFHLSFLGMAAGVIVDSLFYYRGALRLTEGESLAFADPNAYDEEFWGPFFNHQRMRGTVTLHKLYTQYKEGNLNKGVANEISIVDGDRRAREIIYPTRHLAFDGFKLFRNRDGFAPLLVLSDRRGRELYGAYIPLQSIRATEKSEPLYATGTRQAPGVMDFPQIEGMPPLFHIQLVYHLPKRTVDRNRATFTVFEASDSHTERRKPLFEGTVPMGKRAVFGEYALEMREVRYWASMDVVYAPGQPLILASFWIGFSGLVMTAVARFSK
jgi:hypothetical protein